MSHTTKGSCVCGNFTYEYEGDGSVVSRNFNVVTLSQPCKRKLSRWWKTPVPVSLSTRDSAFRNNIDQFLFRSIVSACHAARLVEHPCLAISSCLKTNSSLLESSLPAIAREKAENRWPTTSAPIATTWFLSKQKPWPASLSWRQAQLIPLACSKSQSQKQRSTQGTVFLGQLRSQVLLRSKVPRHRNMPVEFMYLTYWTCLAALNESV